MKRMVWLLICVVCAACGSNTANVSVPLEDIAALSTQAVNLQVTSQADRSAILATVAAADIQAQQQQTYNNLLLATVRAGEVPTPSERLALTAGGAMSAEMLNTTSGEFALQQIGTAGFVRPEDDCFQTHQQYFDRMTTNTIYMTGVAVNVVQGTALRVDWIYDNQIVYTSSWSAPSDAEVRCFAIPMNASEVVFNEGAWTARLFLNGVPFESKAFEIVG